MLLHQRTLFMPLTTLSVIAALQSFNAAEAASSNSENCKVVERQPGQGSSGTLSTSVQAGNGKVSAQSTGGDGVTVHSGNGSSSSVATTTGSGGRTTVATSDGGCITYVNPGNTKENKQ